MKSYVFSVEYCLECAKRTLFSSTSVSLETFTLLDNIGFYTLTVDIYFKKVNEDLFTNILKSVEKMLYDAKLDKAKIHDIVFVDRLTKIRSKVSTSLKLISYMSSLR
ncbi:heat shock 70 kDa protein-like [Monomorium pharaonis]|uniref:heat shock 70 kDa protein-like n=1 Tax=Monomorium pharaonis TaxID=307658 RepID=UPI0017476DE6|nr:heat shock 70 kDa protein-like [Monomorium pharaonis]